MSSDASFVEFVRDQSGLADRLGQRKMFGEYALYLAGRVIGFVCDNQLLVKPTPDTAALTAGLPQRPIYPGGKPYPLADALLDEPERLRALLLATAEALPLPPPRRTASPKSAARQSTRATPAGAAAKAGKATKAPKPAVPAAPARKPRRARPDRAA